MKSCQSLDHGDARLVIQAIEDELGKRGKAAVIAVADAQGDLIGLLRIYGAPLGSVVIASNKAWTAARERKATRELGESSRDPKKGFDFSFYGDSRYVGWGGGLPVVWNGTVVGSVGVSGLSEEEDAELSCLGVEALLKTAGKSPEEPS